MSDPARGGISAGIVRTDKKPAFDLSIEFTRILHDNTVDAIDLRIGEDEPYFASLRQRWSEGLWQACPTLPQRAVVGP